MKLDWTPVRNELAKWRREGLMLPIWWRDDDATEPTVKLDQLIHISEKIEVPLHLAVIPREATRALGDLVSDNEMVIPVVHGWSHTNHEAPKETKCEFGEGRSIETRREEAAEGLRRIQTLMGDRVASMFVPPWNRVPTSFLPVLKEVGYSCFSTCNPRSEAEPIPGLLQINTHIDPLYWRPSKGLSHPELIVDKITNLLKQRRQGKTDNSEPFGLLTHHLAHEPQVWEFCNQFWQELLEGPTEVYRVR